MRHKGKSVLSELIELSMPDGFMDDITNIGLSVMTTSFDEFDGELQVTLIDINDFYVLDRMEQ